MGVKAYVGDGLPASLYYQLAPGITQLLTAFGGTSWDVPVWLDLSPSDWLMGAERWALDGTNLGYSFFPFTPGTEPPD